MMYLSEYEIVDREYNPFYLGVDWQCWVDPFWRLFNRSYFMLNVQKLMRHPNFVCMLGIQH